MEWDVILSDELEEFSVLRIPPPILPVLCGIGCNGDISDRSIEPNVEHLLVITFLWYRNSPLQVTGYAPFLKAVTDP